MPACVHSRYYHAPLVRSLHIQARSHHYIILTITNGVHAVRPSLPLSRRRRVLAAPVRAQQSGEVSTVGLAAAIVGLVAAPIVGLSEFTLATTGKSRCGTRGPLCQNMCLAISWLCVQ